MSESVTLYSELVPGDHFRFVDCTSNTVRVVEDAKDSMRDHYCSRVDPAEIPHRFAPCANRQVVKIEGSKRYTLKSLDRGALFRIVPNRTLFMKTDEHEQGMSKSVIIQESEQDMVGVISYISLDEEVFPEPGHEPFNDPWYKDEVIYGDLVPGDVFSMHLNDHEQELYVVTGNRTKDGDYQFLSSLGEFKHLPPTQSVYLNSALESLTEQDAD